VLYVVFQPYGFMDSPIPYWHIEDVNVISRWDAGQRFCIRITIPDGSVLLQVSLQLLFIVWTTHCLTLSMWKCEKSDVRADVSKWSNATGWLVSYYVPCTL